MEGEHLAGGLVGDSFQQAAGIVCERLLIAVRIYNFGQRAWKAIKNMRR